jgi:hypothetical protein
VYADTIFMELGNCALKKIFQHAIKYVDNNEIVKQNVFDPQFELSVQFSH